MHELLLEFNLIFYLKQTKLKMMFPTLFVFVVSIISHGISQDAPACLINKNCECCISNPNDGTRDLLDICEIQINPWSCKYGCRDGYYGGKCWNYCPEYCTRCARYFGSNSLPDYQICYLCAVGYYNGTGITNCSTPCPANCAQNICDKTSGNCLHGCVSNNWSGDKCNVCADTWFGNNCDISCPDICKDRKCDKNGECTTGCADDNFDGPHCDQCKIGKYGENCDKDCPVNCKDNTCSKGDGICTYGCHDSFAGNKCDICQPYFYGGNCNNQCYNCLNGVCDQSTGRCVDCDSGKFGEQCDQFCGTGCMNRVCDRSTAVCSQGCLNRYSGDKCCEKNNNCEICDTTTSCSKCKSGFYGYSCVKSCPTNCAGTCDKGTGNCEACKEEKFYGNKCDTPCPTNCLDGQCDKTDGRCRSCVAGFFGDQCPTQCVSNCLDGKCTQNDGRCRSCKLGYYGLMCTETCPTNCEDNMCDQNDGVCNNCIAGFHGDVCDIKCKRQDCVNSICSQTTGLCAIGCIKVCEEEPQTSYGEIIGGIIAAFVIIIVLNNVVWFVWTRRQTKDNKEDPVIHANAIYENDQADPDGYEELQIPRH